MRALVGFGSLVLLISPGSAADLLRQTVDEAARKGAGCQSAKCHVGIEPMHVSTAVHLGCTDCHGGNADVTDKLQAHVSPRYPRFWPTSANPPRTYTLLNREDPAFVRFINPGDLRAATETCGSSGCHTDIVTRVKTSLMSQGSFLWGAALYNNGAFPFKNGVSARATMHTESRKSW